MRCSREGCFIQRASGAASLRDAAKKSPVRVAGVLHIRPSPSLRRSATERRQKINRKSLSGPAPVTRDSTRATEKTTVLGKPGIRRTWQAVNRAREAQTFRRPLEELVLQGPRTAVQMDRKRGCCGGRASIHGKCSKCLGMARTGTAATANNAFGQMRAGPTKGSEHMIAGAPRNAARRR